MYRGYESHSCKIKRQCYPGLDASTSHGQYNSDGRVMDFRYSITYPKATYGLKGPSAVHFESQFLSIDIFEGNVGSLNDVKSQCHKQGVHGSSDVVSKFPNIRSVNYPESEPNNSPRIISNRNVYISNTSREEYAQILSTFPSSINLQQGNSSLNSLHYLANMQPYLSEVSKTTVATTPVISETVNISQNSNSKRENLSLISKGEIFSDCDNTVNDIAKEGRLVSSMNGASPIAGTSRVNIETQFRIENGFFICLICGKPSRYKCNFLRHYRIHIVEKPYSCRVCERKFYSSETLEGHAKMHHGKKKMVCNVSKRIFQKLSTCRTYPNSHYF